MLARHVIQRVLREARHRVWGGTRLPLWPPSNAFKPLFIEITASQDVASIICWAWSSNAFRERDAAACMRRHQASALAPV
jgi:hypothetical protein